MKTKQRQVVVQEEVCFIYRALTQWTPLWPLWLVTVDVDGGSPVEADAVVVFL